jgi:hypothetical protein
MFARRTFFMAVMLAVLLSQFAPTPTLIHDRASAATTCNWAGFVADMTVSDGSIKLPGETFIKTWRLKNIGSCAWSTAYTLVYFKGGQLSTQDSVPMPTRVSPGETVDISVPMTAPSTPGHYRSYWILMDDNGHEFGIGEFAVSPIWVDINVSTTYGSTYDLAANVCAATWRSGAGVLPCPGTDGDARGFVFKMDNPTLEDGSTDSLPGLVVAPQNKFNGYLQGFYPEVTVQNGDRFQAIVGCAHGASSCLVTFRLDYQIDGGAIYSFWIWNEKNEGKTYRVDKDLSYLTG